MKAWVALFTLVALLTGCGGEETEVVGEVGDLKPRVEVDVASLQGFALAQAPSGQGAGAVALAGEPKQSLYGVDAAGQLAPVKLSTSPDESVEKIHGTAKYVLLEVKGVFFQGKECRLVPLRKSDGALFCVNKAVSSAPFVGAGLTPLVQTDASGDLLFVLTERDSSSGPAVTRLDMRDPRSPTETELVSGSTGDSAWRMVVNTQGDALVALNGDVLKLFPLAGPTQNLSGRSTYCHARAPVGDETSFFYAGFDSTGREGVHKLEKKQDGSFVSSLYTEQVPGSFGCYNFLRTDKKVFVKGIAPSASYFEMVNEGHTVVSRTIPGNFGGPPQVLPVKDGVVAWADGGELLVRHSVETDETTELIPAGQFRIQLVDAVPSGELTFSGTRLSDGQRVVGSYGADGLKVSVVANNTLEVRQLVRLR